MDPTTLGILAISAGVFQAGSSIIGGYSAANAASANAGNAKAYAKYVEQNAAYNAELQRKKNARVLADQRTAVADNGLSLDGSYFDLLWDSAKSGELDALQIENQGKAEAAMYKAQAAQYKSDASSSLFGGYVGGFTSLLGSAFTGLSTMFPTLDAAPASAGSPYSPSYPYYNYDPLSSIRVP